jgi:aspartate/methionine/tyrosine aminotransferase
LSSTRRVSLFNLLLIFFSNSNLSKDNPVGKVFSREELQRIADLCLKHQIIILSDEVYDRLYYVPFTRIATLSPEVENITLTVGSAGKNFYATGWRVGASPLLLPQWGVSRCC